MNDATLPWPATTILAPATAALRAPAISAAHRGRSARATTADDAPSRTKVVQERDRVSVVPYVPTIEYTFVRLLRARARAACAVCLSPLNEPGIPHNQR